MMKQLLSRLSAATRLWVITLIYEIVFITPLDISKRFSPALGIYLLSIFSGIHVFYPTPISFIGIIASYIYTLAFSRRLPRLSIDFSLSKKTLKKVMETSPENLIIIPLDNPKLVKAVIESFIIHADKLSQDNIDLSNRVTLHSYVVWFEAARKRGIYIIRSLTKAPSQ